MRRTASPVSTEGALPYLSDTDRLAVYNLILSGCAHLWSKNSLQEDRLATVLDTLIPLTVKDPFFLSHLLSYVMTKSQSKDLKIVVSYVNSLNQADGSPFSPGSQYKKPNLRYVSSAALQMLDPKLAKRVAELATRKFSVKDVLNEAQHFPSALRTAFNKYLAYREANLEIVRGIKKVGLGNTYANLYRILHRFPSDEVAAILRWQQKGKDITFEKTQFDFEGKTDLEIAEYIREKKLPVLGVLGALKKVSPVIAVALLEQCTGNQAVILHKTFEDAGVLSDPEVIKLYQEKVATAKTALDRVENLTKESSKEIQEMLKKTRADVRKEQVGDIGKIFLHIDVSGSMEESLEVAKEKGAIIAEVVKNPQENFMWGLFNTGGEVLPIPKTFEADAFKAILFGRRAGGGTDAFQLYPAAREFGAECDVFISDGATNVGDLGTKIKIFHEQNPNTPKPRVCVLIHVRGQEFNLAIKEGYEEVGIPTSIMKPETLSESAIVAQSIKQAMLGPIQIIQEIMDTPLLSLQNWYFTV